jgi:hypothetical protein
MRPLASMLAVIAVLVAFGFGAGCTDANLQPRAADPISIDNELQVEGEFCPSPPTDALFPVKVLFLVDTSDSMSVTDRGQLRAQAVSKVLQHYAGYPGVEFGVIAFDAEIDVLTDGFTSNPDIAKITARLATADRLTDYQGALGAAYTMLSKDIVESTPAERSRSKYVVVFFSDGSPDPQCSSAPTPCGTTTCPAHRHCRIDTCVDDYLICSVAREDWATAFNPPVDPAYYPQLDRGADYNQPGQILRSVDDIIALQDFFHVGEVRLHTGFLFDPAAASDPLAAPFGLDREGGAWILGQMAVHGRGDFTEFDSATQINFLNVDYTSFKEENDLVSLIATNTNTVPTSSSEALDTDGDGLTDDQETSLKTCVGRTATCTDPTDSDQDGYSDFVEDRNRVSGFDPIDPNKPQLPCTERDDSDGDGLKDCEEAFLKTDPRAADTDGDRLSDRMEILMGLDPLDPADALDDRNRDGVRNADQIRAHLSPTEPLTPEAQQLAYRYDIAPVQKPDGRKCYRFDVKHLRLGTTGRGTDELLGKNRIVVYANEAPTTTKVSFGNLRVACADARYVDGALKLPMSGSIHFEDTDFVDVARFDPDTSCRDLTGTTPGSDAGASGPGAPAEAGPADAGSGG